LATLPERTFVFHSEDVRSRFPVNLQDDYLFLSDEAMHVESISRKTMTMVRDYRKVLRKVLAEKDAFLASHRYEDVTEEMASSIKMGILP